MLGLPNGLGMALQRRDQRDLEGFDERVVLGLVVAGPVRLGLVDRRPPEFGLIGQGLGDGGFDAAAQFADQ